ncbi:MAG TPA: endonuclease/exonuclease/phosphatase family protein [Acidimicrobiales bacterium]|nr:endonuclease/exonuclease/phosphatase family protein [Acidimicrobiales bacterium]
MARADVHEQEGAGATPEAVATEVLGLRAALRSALPAKSLDRNLLIGTWNIRAFGDLADTWSSGPKDKVKRDRRALALITEIVSHFDVVAIQEVRGNLRALRHMMKTLGADWSFTLTDVTRGKAGNDERLAFVFDTRRVKLSGLACELVLSDEDMKIKGAEQLARQFARTPYAVSFLSGGRTFILVTLHVLWGDVPEQRIPELKGIARWARDWAEEIASWGQNLIVLGDFNIDRIDNKAFKAFTETGLHPPPELNEVPRTIFSGKTGGFYDQVAWFDSPAGTPLLTLRYTGRAGGFDFVPFVFPELDRQQLSWRVSDHLPLWCEFSVVRESEAVSPPPPARSPSPSPRGTRPRR